MCVYICTHIYSNKLIEPKKKKRISRNIRQEKCMWMQSKRRDTGNTVGETEGKATHEVPAKKFHPEKYQVARKAVVSLEIKRWKRTGSFVYPEKLSLCLYVKIH